MELKIMASSIIDFELNAKGKTILKGCTVDLDASKDIDLIQYINGDGDWTFNGLKAAENCFIQGIVAVIKFKINGGHVGEDGDLERVMSEIKRGLSAEVEIVKMDAECARKGFNSSKN